MLKSNILHPFCHPAVECDVLAVDEIVSRKRKPKAEARYVGRNSGATGGVLGMVGFGQFFCRVGYYPAGRNGIYRN